MDSLLALATLTLGACETDVLAPEPAAAPSGWTSHWPARLPAFLAAAGSKSGSGAPTGRPLGFSARYKKGANVPSGNSNFTFQDGGLHFNSSTYDAEPSKLTIWPGSGSWGSS